MRITDNFSQKMNTINLSHNKTSTSAALESKIRRRGIGSTAGTHTHPRASHRTPGVALSAKTSTYTHHVAVVARTVSRTTREPQEYRCHQTVVSLLFAMYLEGQRPNGRNLVTQAPPVVPHQLVLTKTAGITRREREAGRKEGRRTSLF